MLGTDLDWDRRKVADAFKQMMSIEEPFRDGKNARYGRGPRQTKIGGHGRPERLLLVPAFAYVLLLAVGLVCRDTVSEAHWASATTKTDDRACGFTLERYTLARA